MYGRLFTLVHSSRKRSASDHSSAASEGEKSVDVPEIHSKRVKMSDAQPEGAVTIT
jgi:hypothetical protein